MALHLHGLDLCTDSCNLLSRNNGVLLKALSCCNLSLCIRQCGIFGNLGSLDILLQDSIDRLCLLQLN